MVLLACLMLEDVRLQLQFTNWPLHITIVPWYEISNSKLPEFLRRLQETADGIGEIEANTDRIDYFGRNRSVMVRTIERSNQLARLHEEVLNTMESCGECMVSKCSTFKPHVTLESKEQLKAGEKLRFEDICIVARNDRRMRQVVDKIKLVDR